MKTNPLALVRVLSDFDLLARVKDLTLRERQATAELVAHLAEVDRRRLYLGQGCSSLFTYCTQVLGFSGHEAYGRIEAARAAKKFPLVLDFLGQGALHLTAVGLLAPHLTEENHRAVLAQARFKSKREVEVIVARLRPQPDVPAFVRKLPDPTPPPAPAPSALFVAQDTPAPGSPAASTPAALPPALPPVPPAPPRPAVVAPLSPERFKIQFTASAETHDKLRRVQDLMRHELCTGDIAAIFDRALGLLLADLEKKKLAATERPRQSRQTAPGSRHIPAAVKRAVWARDGGRCTFVSPEGRRCTETGMLQWDHVDPHALGGEATVESIRLRCAAHNRYTAELFFGPPPLCAREPQLSYDPEGSIADRSTRSGPSPCQRFSSGESHGGPRPPRGTVLGQPARRRTGCPSAPAHYIPNQDGNEFARAARCPAAATALWRLPALPLGQAPPTACANESQVPALAHSALDKRRGRPAGTNVDAGACPQSPQR